MNGTLRVAPSGSAGVERAVEPLHLARLPVGEGDLQRFLNDHIPVGPCVKILAHTPFQKLDVHHLVTLRDSDLLAEHLEGLGGVATAAHSAESRHTRIVPSGDKAFLDEFQKLSLAHQGIGEVQSGELVLMARPDLKGLDEPVVQRSVDIELKSADRVGDVFY